MKELRPIERVAYVTGALLFLSGVVHAVVLIASGGSWTGPLSMRKAVTFGLSFGLTLATVAWATSYVAVRPRVRNALLGVFTGASVVETVLVSMQAWRGVPSHFNFETGFDNAVSTTLAAGGGVIILTAVSFTAAAMRGEGETTASMRLAVRFGLVALLVALGAGAAMIASGVVEARGGNPQAAYTTAGALKPLHAVAMHAILILPGLAWLLRFADWTERRRVRLGWVAIGGYTLLTAVVGVESVTGVSPLAASPAEMVTSGLALGVLGLTGAAALREAVRARRSVL
ncbi:hypothetical protein SD37_08260 [Amycolatopsis orientalis]|uniref:Uncharacterized protein n=1 Tax=Amycolatopsis orientalis TaxID=31958 RepID=A0A193BTV4_AMYOR|nr:hypothetical protein [Amycolatopsis orientalis]ANN15651.1 hypothetical protein SD37_08260 [Amycolatopsis orientalis]